METLKKIFAQIKEYYKKINKKTRKIMLVAIVAILVFSVGLTLILNNVTYETLYYNLNTQETGEIAGKLSEYGVEYKIKGDSILVPKEQVDQLKGRLAQEGYPKSGLSYSALKNIDIMTTDTEKRMYLVIDLQSRIEGTIRTYTGVKQSIVTIALGEEQKYVLQKDKIEPSASVVVVMRDGGSPTPGQINGIQRLVATGVPGMKIENVAVFNGNGEEVTGNSNESSQLGASQLKMNLEREIENSVEAKVFSLLGPLFGEKKVRVSAKGNVDVDKKIKEIISYLPGEDGKGVIDNETTGTEVQRGESADGGVTGTDSNADIPVYDGITVSGDTLYFRDEKSISYLVNQIKEQVQSDAGVLTDLTVAVALDGVAMEPEKMEELKKYVAIAAGIKLETADEKISIFNQKFAETAEADTKEAKTSSGILDNDLIRMGIIGAAALIFIFILFLIVKSMFKKKKVPALAIAEAGPGGAGIAAPAPEIDYTEINLQEIKNTREMELKSQISEFAEKNPEISAQLIRTWLMGGEDQ